MNLYLQVLKFFYQKIPIMVDYICINSNQITNTSTSANKTRQIVITSLNIINIESIVKKFMEDIYIHDKKNKNKDNIRLYKYHNGLWITDEVLFFNNISYIHSNEKNINI